MPRDYLLRLPGALPRARDPLRRRRGAVRRGADREDVGGRALRRRRARPARLGQVDRRRPAARGRDRRRRRSWTPCRPGGLGGTFGGNPLSCAAAVAVLDAVAEPEFLAQATALGETMRARLDQLAAKHAAIGEVRGLGPMLAFELAEQAPEQAAAIVAAAFERGLLLLACGMYGNVIRLLAPLTIDDGRARARAWRCWRSRLTQLSEAPAHGRRPDQRAPQELRDGGRRRRRRSRDRARRVLHDARPVRARARRRRCG